MDRPYNRIMVPFDRDEWVKLRQAAESDMRHPRDQARFILRQALGLAEKRPSEGKQNGAALSSQAGSGAIVMTVQG